MQHNTEINIRELQATELYHYLELSDDGGRYTYMRQPEICKWNCLKLAEAIQDVVPLSETKPLLDIFDEEFGKHYKMKMRQKVFFWHGLDNKGKITSLCLFTSLWFCS